MSMQSATRELETVAILEPKHPKNSHTQLCIWDYYSTCWYWHRFQDNPIIDAVLRACQQGETQTHLKIDVCSHAKTVSNQAKNTNLPAINCGMG